MSSVTPTDNGYNYYQKKLSEDESEIQAEAKRNEENRNRIAKAQEERFNKTLQKNESELQERATQIHEQSNEAIQSSRESARRVLRPTTTPHTRRNSNSAILNSMIASPNP